MAIPEFNVGHGWLYCFQKCHGIHDKKMWGKSQSVDEGSVHPFHEKLEKIIQQSDFMQCQLCNADEIGFYWKEMPRNTQATKEDKAPGRKLVKDYVSLLLFANVDGSHRLTPVVVGKTQKPRTLKNILGLLPIIYRTTKNAWINCEIFYEWFYKFFVPAVRNFQKEKKISADDVRVILLLDNAPAHLIKEQLCTKDGKIKCMFLPPNTTPLIQPMDQSMTEATKKHYRWKQTDNCLVVLETEADRVEDTRGQRTLENLKKYHMHNVVYNIAETWKAVKVMTLHNGWNKLLRGTDFTRL